MKIGIDVRPIQVHKQRWRGVGSYARNLLAAIKEIDHENEYYLYADRRLPLDEQFDAPNFHIESSTLKSGWLTKNPYVQRQMATPIDLKRRHYDLFHFLFSQDAPFFCPSPYIVTVHDLISLIFPADYRHNPLRSYYDRAWLRAARFARKIVAVSETTKQDLVKIAGIDPDMITVIYEGVAPEFFSPPPSERAEELAELSGLPDKFIFYLGGLDKRKNLVTLFTAMAALDPELRAMYPLVIAGEPDQWFDRTRAEIDEAGVADSVLFTGFLSLEELIVAYRRASVFVMPSLYEGFGLPVLEAMACRTPVVCANAGSLPEIAGESALMFDPLSSEQLSAAITRVLSDSTFASQISEAGVSRAKQFLWSKTAEQTISAYRDCIKASLPT